MKLLQLTLRDLFWLVLVCAFAVGWWRDRLLLQQESALQLLNAEAHSQRALNALQVEMAARRPISGRGLHGPPPQTLSP